MSNGKPDDECIKWERSCKYKNVAYSAKDNSALWSKTCTDFMNDKNRYYIFFITQFGRSIICYKIMTCCLLAEATLGLNHSMLKYKLVYKDNIR